MLIFPFEKKETISLSLCFATMYNGGRVRDYIATVRTCFAVECLVQVLAF